jgi:hypothetical protein
MKNAADGSPISELWCLGWLVGNSSGIVAQASSLNQDNALAIAPRLWHTLLTI